MGLDASRVHEPMAACSGARESCKLFNNNGMDSLTEYGNRLKIFLNEADATLQKKKENINVKILTYLHVRTSISKK